MEAIVALKSSCFGNNCESESAAFGLFSLLGCRKSDPVTSLKTICHFVLSWGYSCSIRQYMCYPMQLRLRQVFSLSYKGYPFDTYIHNERRFFTTASFATQQVSLRERIRLLAGRV